MKRSIFFCLLAIAFVRWPAKAQSSYNDSITLQSALHNSLQVYHNALYPETSLYNGSRYAFYPFEFKEGQPFFVLAEKDTSYIIVDHVRYDSVVFLYDLVRQKIVINNPAGDAIFLHNEKVNEFSQGGYRFIRVNSDSGSLSPGFYALLHDGRFTLLQKREKTIRRTVTSDGEQRFVDEKIKNFVRKGVLYFPADSKRSVLNLFPEKRNDLQQYIRQENLSFKKGNLEKSLIRLVQYCEKIIP